MYLLIRLTAHEYIYFQKITERINNSFKDNLIITEIVFVFPVFLTTSIKYKYLKVQVKLDWSRSLHLLKTQFTSS